jgi:REP element-mobilizing transposase RayT
MSTRSETTQLLLPESYFHIYNRANGEHNIFFCEEHYHFFLRRYAKYLGRYVETFAYCLLPNHFHFLLRIRSASEIFEATQEDYSTVPHNVLKSLKFNSPTSHKIDNCQQWRSLPSDEASQVAALLVSNQFRTAFLSYSKAINKSMGRRGSLLQKPFRRKLVDKHGYMLWLIWYIHRNPLHHNITADFRNYYWSSYQSFFSERYSQLARSEVMSWFENRLEVFEEYHQAGEMNWQLLSGLVLEE